jgi:ATP-dependent Clp protease ATP-binding subunit ClpA
MRQGDGLAAQVLHSLGLDIAEVRKTIDTVLGRNERVIIQQIIPTSRVKKVIEIAFEECRRMGNSHVGTHHLLLGLAIEGEGIAAHVMQDLGADTIRIQAEVERLLASGATEPGLAAPDRSAEFQVGQRVLVHDPEAPHRLWEGRLSKSSGNQWEVAIPDRPAGEAAIVEAKLLHPVPMRWTRDCPFCQS